MSDRAALLCLVSPRYVPRCLGRMELMSRTLRSKREQVPTLERKKGGRDQLCRNTPDSGLSTRENWAWLTGEAASEGKREGDLWSLIEFLLVACSLRISGPRGRLSPCTVPCVAAVRYVLRRYDGRNDRRCARAQAIVTLAPMSFCILSRVLRLHVADLLTHDIFLSLLLLLHVAPRYH